MEISVQRSISCRVWMAGIDEAGMSPLAGPVSAAAVMSAGGSEKCAAFSGTRLRGCPSGPKLQVRMDPWHFPSVSTFNTSAW
jgi:hypothetical protein